MALDRSKVLETAQKHLAKGQYDKAIAEYQKLVQEDPRDVRTWLKIGDLYTRKGARKEACQTYERVARHYADQGFFLKAVAVYKQILKLEPNQLDVQLQLADMYEQLQLVSDALGTYEQVAAAYARAGNIDKALETLGRMAELDPENIPVRIKYAEALSKAGRRDEAANEFEAGAQLLKEQGRMDDYIKVAERMLFHRPDDADTARELAEAYLERNDAKRALSKLQLCFKADPRNVDTLELLARAFHVLGQTQKTISVFKEAARIHHDAGRTEDHARTLKRILQLDPNDAEARQAMAQYAEASQPSASQPSAPASQPSQASASQPSHASASHSSMSQASRSAAELGPPPSAVVESTAGPAPEPSEEEMLLEADDAEILDADEVELVEDEEDEAPEIEVGGAPQPTVEPQAGSPKPSIPPDVQQEAQVARLLTECDVFLRYGLKNKVVEALNKVLELAPDNVEARERLKDTLIELGRNDEAVAQLHALADLFEQEKPQLSQLYLKQVLELAPHDARALQRTGGESTVERPLPAEDDEVFFVDDEDAPPADVQTSLDAPPAEAVEQEVLQQGAPEPAPAEPAEEEFEVTIDDEGFEEAEPAEPPPAAEPPAQTGAGADTAPPAADTAPPAADTSPPGPDAAPLEQPSLEDMEQALRPMTPDEFEAAPVAAASPGEAAAEARERVSLPPGEVEEVLDEAEFFMAQGLWSEARNTLQETLSNHPDHPVILDKLNEIAEAEAAQAGQAASAEVMQPEPDQSFELAEKLAEELGEQPQAQSDGSEQIDVETVFAQFKKGVEEQIGLEDADTHFDLGIAYKEMGLIDDSINEFKLCLDNPHRECMAHTMIGLCHVERGNVAEAISHFKKGLYAEHKTEREELGLYFELGQAYQALNDAQEALYYFQKVQKRDPDFRGVEEKIRELTQPQPEAEEPEAPSVGSDDVDQAFDDLMRED